MPSYRTWRRETSKPVKRKQIVIAMQKKHQTSERMVCRAINQSRSSCRYIPVKRNDEDEIRSKIIYLATNFGRVGYRMVCDMLHNKGISINHKRVERIWREEGLKLPQKQPKRRRLWLNDGSCIRLRPEYKNHVWSYDFIEDKLSNGKKVRWLNIIDEHEHEHVCLASVPRRSWRFTQVIAYYPVCFCNRAALNISAATMAVNLPPTSSENGLRALKLPSYISNREARGKTDILKVLTAECGDVHPKN